MKPRMVCAVFHQRLACIGPEQRQRLVELAVSSEPETFGHLLELAIDLAAEPRDDRLLFRRRYEKSDQGLVAPVERTGCLLVRHEIARRPASTGSRVGRSRHR